MCKIKINPLNILNVPLQAYGKDFTFIVNGKEFETSRIISDLISRKICQIHLQDPTFDTYVINTQHSGDFSLFLNLYTFNEIAIPETDSEFFIEVIENLGSDSIEILGARTTEEITNDNVISYLKTHLKFGNFFRQNIEKEIDFISSNFFSICELHKSMMIDLPTDILLRIVSSDKLQINSEDQLLEFSNLLYSKSSENSVFYEFVQFDKVTKESMTQFVSLFDFSELTNETWANLSKRLQLEIKNDYSKSERVKKCQPFTAEVSNRREGILCRLKNIEQNHFDQYFITSQSSGDIYNLIDPGTKDEFTIKGVGGYIEIELKEAVNITGVKVFSSTEYFPQTFDIEINGELAQSIKRATKLNGENRSMTVFVENEKCRKIRFVNRGSNWEYGNNYIRLKRIELLSNEPVFAASGVFASLVSNAENKDPHKCDVFISASKFDLNSFHSIDSRANICTYSKTNSWFQIEFTKGLAVINGYRLGRCEQGMMRSYKIICSDDENKKEEDWTTLMQVDEENEDEHETLDVYKFEKPSPPIKYVRLIQTGPNWDNDLHLKFYHFDLFGSYLC